MRDNVVPVLNELIEVCRDGETGFLEALESLQEHHLRSLFSDFAEQRRQFGLQLQYEVSKRGATPEQTGSLMGRVHRRWMDVRSAMTGSAAVIAECERGEDMAQRAYRKALKKKLPAEVLTIIEGQYLQIQDVLERLRSIEVKFPA